MSTETVTKLPRARLFAQSDPLAAEALDRAIVASVASLEAPPEQWFGNPGLDGPTPLTVTADGRVYGHIAAWDSVHIGLPGEVHPPKSRSGYSYFRTGQLRTAEGTDVSVGQLTLAGGHAPISAGAAAAVKHYDDTASAVADLAAGEDSHGIWVSGALRASATKDQIRALRASAPSGDWRPINGALELVAICQVNVPGFPIARARVASGAMLALVAAGAQDMAMLRYRNADQSVVGRVAELENQVRGLVAAAEARVADERRGELRRRARRAD